MCSPSAPKAPPPPPPPLPNPEAGASQAFVNPQSRPTGFQSMMQQAALSSMTIPLNR